MYCTKCTVLKIMYCIIFIFYLRLYFSMQFNVAGCAFIISVCVIWLQDESHAFYYTVGGRILFLYNYIEQEADFNKMKQAEQYNENKEIKIYYLGWLKPAFIQCPGLTMHTSWMNKIGQQCTCWLSLVSPLSFCFLARLKFFLRYNALSGILFLNVASCKPPWT